MRLQIVTELKWVPVRNINQTKIEPGMLKKEDTEADPDLIHQIVIGLISTNITKNIRERIARIMIVMVSFELFHLILNKTHREFN